MMAEIDQTDLAVNRGVTSMLEVKSDAYKTRQQEIQQPTSNSMGNSSLWSQRNSKKTPTFLPSSRSSTTHASIWSISNIIFGNPTMRRGLRPRINSINYSKSIIDLWELKYPEILMRLTVGSAGDAQSLAAIQELSQKVETLKKKKAKQAELFKEMQIDQKATNDDTFEADFPES